jgi:hypothetical protein
MKMEDAGDISGKGKGKGKGGFFFYISSPSFLHI